MKKYFNAQTIQLFYKRVIPFSGSVGVISDVASPLASFSLYLTFATGLAAVLLGVYWFGFFDRSKEWSIEKGFMPRALIYAGLSVMVFGFFAVGQAYTGTEDRGLVAKVIPGIKSIQETVFRIEKTTAEMNKKLDVIHDNLDRKYSLEEMQILIEQEMWVEAMEHLEDTPPMGRDAEWKRILFEVAEGWLYDMDIHEDLDQSYKQVRDLFQKFKVLKKSPEAMKYRKKIGLRYIRDCLSARELRDCDPLSNHFIRYDKDSVEELAFEVGKLTTYHRIHRGAIPYFKLAVNEDNKEEYCKEERLQLAIGNGFYDSEGSQMAKDSWALASLCFKNMTEYFNKMLEESRSLSSSAERICELFENQGSPHERCALLAKVQAEKEAEQEARQKAADERRQKRKSKNKKK